MKIDKVALRSVRGQLGILAVVYAGAVVLAVAGVCLRTVFLERFVLEKFAEVPEELPARAAEVAAGKADAATLTDKELDRTYAVLIERPTLDPDGRLARTLLSVRGDVILARIRRTLVVGNFAQREQAVRLLAQAANRKHKAEALALARYAQERARRRGEHDLREQAEAAERRLEAVE